MHSRAWHVTRLLAPVLSALVVGGCTTEPPALPAVANATASPTDATSPAVKDTLSVDFPSTDIREILLPIAAHFKLKLDLPRDLEGETSIKLRDVTWRQIFSVTLTPAGYDYYERDGVVIVRTKEEIDALPHVTRRFKLSNQSPADVAAYLKECYENQVRVSIIDNGLEVTAHPKRIEMITARASSIDSPSINLNPFTRPIFFPDTIPALAPDPQRHSYINGSPDWNILTTEIFILSAVNARALKARLMRELPSRESLIIVDPRINALVISAPGSAMPKLESIVKYLDDERWYQTPASPKP